MFFPANFIQLKGLTIKIFDLIDEIINIISPFVAGGFLIFTVYVGAVVHGGVTYMQVCKINCLMQE